MEKNINDMRERESERDVNTQFYAFNTHARLGSGDVATPESPIDFSGYTLSPQKCYRPSRAPFKTREQYQNTSALMNAA